MLSDDLNVKNQLGYVLNSNVVNKITSTSHHIINNYACNKNNSAYKEH